MSTRTAFAGVVNSINMQSLNEELMLGDRKEVIQNIDEFILDDSSFFGQITLGVDGCDAVNCDEDLCSIICDIICEVVCDKVCDEWCDGVCDRICDRWCDKLA